MQDAQASIKHCKSYISISNVSPQKSDHKISSDSKIHKNSTGAVFVKENIGNIKDLYKISGAIGTGAYGEVRKCLHRDTKVQRAVKIINKNMLDEV